MRYEIGWSGHYKDEKTGEPITREWEFVENLLNRKIELICEDVGATQPPILYLTNDKVIQAIRDRYARFRGKVLPPPKPNFREEIAIQKGYKAQRKAEKPFHFNNLTSYMLAAYNTKVADGVEADDLIVMEQFSRLDKADTIICTRDKDLRMCPGWHYGWECGKQPSYGPEWIDEIGYIKHNVAKKKIEGGGLKFFFAQVLMGDSADNIPGLKGAGPVKVMSVLDHLNTECEMYQTVKELYKEAYPDNYMQMLVEQMDLLWMIREPNTSYDYKKWEFNA